MIKHIFSDMDHTLLNEKSKLTPATIATIQQLTIPFTCVSARAPQEMLAVINQLKLKGPQIAFNGGLIFEKAAEHIKYLNRKPILPTNARAIINLIHTQFPETSLSWYNQNTWFTFKLDAGVKFEHQVNGTMPQVVMSPNYQEDIYKIMIIEFNHAQKAQIAKAVTRLGLTNVIAKSTGADYYEITTRAATKDAGVRFIQQKENLIKDEMMAFGDGENDLPLLNAIGSSVAMGNALPEVKKAAKIITRSNQEDGVAFELKKLLK